MKRLLSVAMAILLVTSVSNAVDEVPLPAVSGFDVVSYFTEGKAVKGSGFHTANFEAQTYLFSTASHKELFEKNPEKFLPQYGGWCAYGVAIGKKFHVDPTVFEIVDGKLYLNLDQGIKSKWAEDKSGYIDAADAKWRALRSSAVGG